MPVRMPAVARVMEKGFVRKSFLVAARVVIFLLGGGAAEVVAVSGLRGRGRWVRMDWWRDRICCALGEGRVSGRRARGQTLVRRRFRGRGFGMVGDKHVMALVMLSWIERLMVVVEIWEVDDDVLSRESCQLLFHLIDSVINIMKL